MPGKARNRRSLLLERKKRTLDHRHELEDPMLDLHTCRCSFLCLLLLSLFLLPKAAVAAPWPDADTLLGTCSYSCEQRAEPQAKVGNCIEGCDKAKLAYTKFIEARRKDCTSLFCHQAVTHIERRARDIQAGYNMGALFYAGELQRSCP